MTSVKNDSTVLDRYQMRLPTFEGPLDLLLRLIERNQLAITDVSLVAVTDQFFAYTNRLGGASAQVVADFAAVGARLVLLKSRNLLPRPPAAIEEPEYDDLVSQLEVYQSLKKAAKFLAECDLAGRVAFAPRSPGMPQPVTPFFTLTSYPPTALRQSLRRRLRSVGYPALVLESKPIVSLRETIDRILRSLADNPSTHLSKFIRGHRARPEAMTAFLAILVLIRCRLVVAEQASLFGEITIRLDGVPTDLQRDPITMARESADD
ncbi:MAG: segregation/condensation protein A [Chloroflexia bacterium]|nr:segregation/condensation protein A [Chloroflexia bacterium]